MTEEPGIDGGAADHRRPRSVYGVGTEPDPRFSMANERTALAWQRTGLGVVVGSFLVFHSSVQLGVLPIGILAIVLGLLVAALAVFAFLTGRYLRGAPADSWVLLLAVTTAVVALGILGTAVALLTTLSA